MSKRLLPAVGFGAVGLVAAGLIAMQTANVSFADDEVGKRDDDQPTLVLVDDDDADDDDTYGLSKSLATNDETRSQHTRTHATRNSRNSRPSHDNTRSNRTAV